MKKNRMMRIASVLLVAVLLTTSIISGTFAKYVTSGEAEDSARVAKFGVIVTGTGSLFAENYWYVDGEAGNQPSDHTGTGTNHDVDEIGLLTVESSNGDKLVAPGTENPNGLTLAITGAPEVDVKITLSVDKYKDIFLKGGKYYKDMTTSDPDDNYTFTGTYNPVLFTLSKGGVAIEDATDVTLEELAAFLETYEVYVDANTDLSAGDYVFTLTWKWAFEGDYEHGEVEIDEDTVDKADTTLGDIAAARLADDYVAPVTVGGQALGADTDYSVNTNVTLSLAVTQVD